VNVVAAFNYIGLVPQNLNTSSQMNAHTIYALNNWTVIEIFGDRVSNLRDHVAGIANHLATASRLASR
jgi:hypothetical protein